MVHPADNGFKPSAPSRTHIVSPVRPADALPFGEPDAHGPVSAFAALVRCTGERDFRGATAARKQLRRFGWAVAPCGKGATR